MSDSLATRLRNMATWDFLEPDRRGNVFDHALLREAADALEAAEADLKQAEERRGAAYLSAIERMDAAEARAAELARSNEWLRSDRALECVDGCQMEAKSPGTNGAVNNGRAPLHEPSDPDSAQHVERVRRVIALTESRNNAPVVCADHPFLVEDLRALVGPDKAKQPCPSCGTERGKIRGIDPTFEVWDGEFCSQCGYMPKRQQNRTLANRSESDK